MSMNHPLSTLAPRILLASLLYCLPCIPALAESQLEFEEAETEAADDENVEDIESSKPLRKNIDHARKISHPDQAGASEDPESSPKKKKIAPHINLKELAPPPGVQSFFPETGASETVEPEPEPEPKTATETTPKDPHEVTPTVSNDQASNPESTNASDTDPTKEVARAITLLGTEIMPGTSTRLSWSSGMQIAGLSQSTPVLVVNGSKPGPTLCLTGAVHGDELNGIEIVRRTLYDLDPEMLAGRVIGVPIVNLQGFQQGSRYLSDRRDLNRHFPGNPTGNLADRIAYSLFNEIISHCTMLVDIHTGSLKRTNLPQLRADMNIAEVRTFVKGFDRMAVVHSSGTTGMLRTAALDAGIVAVSMESGESLRIQEKQIKAGVNSLNSLMEKQNMISRLFVWGKPEPIHYDSYWIRAEHAGILFSKKKLGDRVIKGQVLGVVTDPITNASHAIHARDTGRIIGMAVDQVVMAGFAAYHIGAETEIPDEE
ncbi:succinylglutamate desuccinylase/aspartoacylase family protein [Porticoccus hydrocarbonoclasticus]|jgi:predicted deacylase|uniref:succinylglutamate desuccinylase/aspartoacylase family protein n=1 Tax=Porticoccus hydrocarbonoclasticus TaxID=1073414 RepID=UPI000ABB6F35|nr:succinylglutamate desuccinylase/aspartoacylase family protein [Porticoccus hydrocarbonoclasticus]